MPDIPAHAKDFTVDWMNSALAGHLGDVRVTDCDAVDSDIPGQTAEIVQINVKYSGVTDLPARMIAKITSRNPDVINLVIANYDQYRRETSFYREFPDIGIAVPWCLYEQHNRDTQSFIILMKDLTPAASPSWAATPAQVEQALEALPGFHGKWWNDMSLRSKDWLVQFDNEAFFAAALGAANHAAPTLEKLYEDSEITRQIMEYANNNLDRMLAFMASRPFTFVHGDYHAKQMFFPTAAGGEFAVIDWQFPFVAQGPWDFARMAGMCLSTETRLEREDKLLTRYHEGLHDAGVENYNRQELETDYRFGLIISQMIMAIASADTDYRLFEAECDALNMDWRDVMFDRTNRALKQWDALEFIRSV